MSPERGRFAHRSFLVALLVTIAVLALLWSVHGLGYPNPHDSRYPLRQITEDSDRARAAAITRYSLLCLDHLSKSRATEAIASCDRALKIDGKDVATLNLRGNAHWLAGHGSQAIADFSRAIKLAPRNPEAFRFRAIVYAALHRDGSALADFSHAIQLAPGDPLNVELRGHFYRSRGNYRLAIADFSAAIAVRPLRDRAWNSRCWTRLLANEDLTKALSDCDRALELNPLSTNALDSRGFVLLRMNRFAEAIGSFSKALRIDAKLASSWFGRGAAKLSIRNRGGARDIARAKLLEPGIAGRFLSYGIKLRNATPGT